MIKQCGFFSILLLLVQSIYLSGLSVRSVSLLLDFGVDGVGLFVEYELDLALTLAVNLLGVDLLTWLVNFSANLKDLFCPG